MERTKIEKDQEMGSFRIIVEKPLPNPKKAELVIAVLKLLLREQLTMNQVLEILTLAQSNVYKIPITGSCNKND